MATLQIKKKSLYTWEHIDSDLGTFILSKFYFSADGTKFQIVEQGQAKRRIYDITDISVYDIGGSAETFATTTLLSLRLEELKYPAYNLGGVFTFSPSNYDLSEFNNAEVDRFAKLSDITGGVTPKYATLTSSQLTSQDIAGFVIYANALSPNLVIASDEFYDFVVTDTGQIFKLYLSGVTIGLGQTAISATDVKEMKRGMPMMLRMGFGQNAYVLSNGAIGTNLLQLDAAITGTAQATTQLPAQNMASLIKYRYITGIISTATAGSTASVRSTAPFIYFGKPCVMEFFNTLEDASVISDGRSFSGIRNGSAVIGNIEPSSIASMIAIANDSTDTNMQIMHNDPTGTAVKIDLGASFPAHYAKGDHSYRMLMYVESVTSVYCYVEDIVTGVNTWRHITTELPVAGQQYAHTWLNNAATAQARIMSFYGYERKYI